MSNTQAQKWSYLPNYNLVKNYIDMGLDFALIGPSKSGKSELIRDLVRGNDHAFIVSCLRNTEPRKLEETVSQHLYKVIVNESTLKSLTFSKILEKLYQYEGQKVVSKKVIIILENVESLLISKNRHFYHFYDHFKNFLKEAVWLKILPQIQIIIISRIDVSLETLKVPMTMPTAAYLQNYVKNCFHQHLSRVTDDIMAKKVHAIESSFVAHTMSFDVARRDFEIYDILVTVLFRELLKGLSKAHMNNQVKDADSILNFKNSLKLLNSNIETAYLPNHEFTAQVNAAIAVGNDEIQRLELECQWEARDRDLEQSLKSIPETAAILLIAFYIENVYNVTDVDSILGKKRAVNKRRQLNRTSGLRMFRNLEKTTHNKAKRVEMDRVVTTAKYIMKNISEELQTPEKKVEYCSLNMALNFDFLVKRHWVSRLIERNGKVYYNFLADERTIKVLVTERFPTLGSEIIRVYD